MHTTTSGDGTTIAYDREGDGDPLVLVGGAFSYRRYPGRRGLGHTKALNAAVIAATLTDFLTGADTTVRIGDNHA